MIHAKAFSQTSGMYTLQLHSIDNGNINMASYQGKKILVVVFDASNPDQYLLQSLDILYTNNSAAMNVIAIPAKNFGSEISFENLRKLVADTLKLSYLVVMPDYVKKTDLSNQNTLMAFLTNINSNGHFDDDIVNAGEMFWISEQGKLFARLKENVLLNSVFMTNQLTKKIN
jgi:glutathione peroxidase